MKSSKVGEIAFFILFLLCLVLIGAGVLKLILLMFS